LQFELDAPAKICTDWQGFGPPTAQQLRLPAQRKERQGKAAANASK
jgi:hypothetical protein